MQKNRIDSIAIWSITPNGKLLGRKIHNAVKGSTFFVSEKLWQEQDKQHPFSKNISVFKKLSKEIERQFNNFSGHVFIFSTGIAIRIIAPLLQSKIFDPAVVVVEDKANYAISFLSGHLGGANALTKKIAAIIKAEPVITTATDTNNLPSIDMIAKKKSIMIETPQNIKHINMAFLAGRPVSLYDPCGIIKNVLPENFWTDASEIGIEADDKNIENKKILCSHEIKKVSRETLILRPPVLSVGIGCNRGTKYKALKEFLLSVLKEQGLSINSVYRFGTTQVKKDETGLLKLSDEMQIKIDFYNNQELNSVKTIKTPSKMVEKHLGVKSVCEAAAILSAASSRDKSDESGGNLIVTKQKNRDVTIAVAIKK
ncbi:MAG: cobalamin biosynthesis protein [Deltaproteobacteria bacterium]|nr:cobalamin biosynthesis protein [Deltaproteobacteria bacterium]